MDNKQHSSIERAKTALAAVQEALPGEWDEETAIGAVGTVCSWLMHTHGLSWMDAMQTTLDANKLLRLDAIKRHMESL